MYDYLKAGIDLSEFSEMNYKSRPSLSHWDKNSKDYIYSEVDETKMRVDLDYHNNAIDTFKSNLAFQKKVIKELQAMDRPYLRNGEKGNTQNVSNIVKDYSNPRISKSNVDVSDEGNAFFGNEKSIINNSIFIPKRTQTKAELEQ